MMNSSVSLVSEMIGHDDQASAVVFAAFNILESLSCGGLAYIVMACGMTESASSLKVLLGIMPVLLATCAYLLSRWRFKHVSDENLGKCNHGSVGSYWTR